MRMHVSRASLTRRVCTQGRRLSKLCKGTFFERLLTRFSVPEVRAASDALPVALLLRC
jgi:hypothetical protein